MALKVGLKKEYDHIDWSFLRLILFQIDLLLIAVDQIMDCVTSTHFYVLVNGSPSIFLNSSMGLI